MKVYLDIIFIINFIYDFIILLGTSLILKRNTSFFKIVLGSVFGTLTMFIYFIRMNNIEMILYKLVISILIIIITFGYKNIKYFFKNIYYFYLIGIILGGLLYFINNNAFFISNNLFIGIILSIICLYFYIKNIKELKTNYNNYIKVIIYFKEYYLSLNAFLDTGNKLKDPYTFKPIILVNKDYIKKYDNSILVPYKTCNNDGLLECIRASKIYIDGIGYKKNFLVGLIDSIKIDGIDCILSESLMEGI